ncbi:hypothetical protein NUSPORA_01921 [Nucleospora cyclopteri]
MFRNNNNFPTTPTNCTDPYVYQSKNEMYSKMTEIAKENSILRVIVNNDNLVSFVCENTQCEAIINGVYNCYTHKYQIIRLNLCHKCSHSTEVVTKSIFNYIFKRSHLSVCDLTKRLMAMNYPVGFLETFAFLQHIKSKGNLTSPSLSELEPLLTSDFLFKNCVKEYERIFKLGNPHFFTTSGDNFFYFNNGDFLKTLRPVREIVVFNTSSGFLITGVMFCPNEEPIISSVLAFKGLSREKAIEKFISSEKDALQADCSPAAENCIFMVGFDPLLIQKMHGSNLDFFIKTRSLVMFLDSTDVDRLSPIDYFTIINYRTKLCVNSQNLIDISPKHFLRYKSPKNLFFLNNSRIVDFDFITDDLLHMDFFDLLNLLQWHMKHDLLEREAEYSDILLSDSANEIVAQNQLRARQLSNDNSYQFTAEITREGGCSCSKYREFKIPCVHFFIGQNEAQEQHRNKENLKLKDPAKINLKKTISMDPLLYASKYYQRYQLKNIRNIELMIKMGPAMYRNLRYKIKINK